MYPFYSALYVLCHTTLMHQIYSILRNEIFVPVTLLNAMKMTPFKLC